MSGRQAPRTGGRRRRPVLTTLVAVFLLLPLLELYLLIQVGQVIGGWWTVGLLVLSAVLGGWLVRREGRRAWTALNGALQSGRMPARELVDAALVLVGGMLMIAPGFVTDAVGALLVLPLTRPLARGALVAALTRRLLAGAGGVWLPGQAPRGASDGHRPSGPQPTGEDVVTGEVVDEPPREP